MIEVLSSSPKSTLAIILGASDFPKAKNWNYNIAFKNSATAFMEYLLDPNGFNLPKHNLLDLFDTEDAPSVIDDKVASFITEHSSHSPTDLLFYYVGHGAFTDVKNQEYYLAVRTTRGDNQDVSGYRMSSIARRLTETYRFKRWYLILDCCFAGAAFEHFQSDGPHEALERQILDSRLPQRGTSLLCAASRRQKAYSPPEQEFTMFSTALLDVLRNGDSTEAEILSFKEVGNLCRHRITQIFKDDAIIPRLYSPFDDFGDVATTGITFPNPAKIRQISWGELQEIREINRQLQKENEQLQEALRLQHGQSNENNTSNETSAILPDVPVKLPRYIGEYYGLAQENWGILSLEMREKLLLFYDSFLPTILLCSGIVVASIFTGIWILVVTTPGYFIFSVNIFPFILLSLAFFPPYFGLLSRMGKGTRTTYFRQKNRHSFDYEFITEKMRQALLSRLIIINRLPFDIVIYFRVKTYFITLIVCGLLLLIVYDLRYDIVRLIP